MYFELNRHPAQVPRTKIEFCPPPQYWAGELCHGGFLGGSWGFPDVITLTRYDLKLCKIPITAVRVFFFERLGLG